MPYLKNNKTSYELLEEAIQLVNESKRLKIKLDCLTASLYNGYEVCISFISRFRNKYKVDLSFILSDADFMDVSDYDEQIPCEPDTRYTDDDVLLIRFSWLIWNVYKAVMNNITNRYADSVYFIADINDDLKRTTALKRIKQIEITV